MKIHLTLCAGIFACLSVTAQVSGPLGGAVFTTTALSGYSLSWQGPQNTAFSDDQYATFGNLPGTTGSHTDYLVASDFHFAIPDNAVVDGIEVTVECSDPDSRTSDYSVRIIKAQQLGSQEKAHGTAYPLTDKDPMIYGGPADLWGETWMPKHINDNFFGVAIAAQRNAPDGITNGRIDMISIAVYYHINITLAVQLNSFVAVKSGNTVLLNWTTANESDMKQYAVERSADGRVFSPVANTPAKNLASAVYSLTDSYPMSGLSYYRLRMDHLAGNSTYSSIAAISFNKYTVINLSPSPCMNCSSLYISNPAREELQIRFYNAGGELIGQATTTTSQVVIPVLEKVNGLVFYKVLNKLQQEKGSGRLLVH